MSPAERGAYLESPPQDAPDIEEAHQVRGGREGVASRTQPLSAASMRWVAFSCMRSTPACKEGLGLSTGSSYKKPAAGGSFLGSSRG
jgi:hypothetical protein